MRGQLRTQLDLFTPAIRITELTDAERRKAVVLLRTLLTEASTEAFGHLSSERSEDAGHEQNHA